VLDLDVLTDALGEAFVELSGGRTSVPPRIAAFTPGGFLGAMPGYLSGTLEAKLVSVFPSNHGTDLPSHHAVIVMFDPETGVPLALLDGTEITAARTACASALATRELARSDATTLAVLGAGVQGRAHLEAVPRVRFFEEVRVASRDHSHAIALASEFDASPAPDFESAVRGADVVCVCTDASAPVIDGSWLAPGAHVTSVGASPKGGELDERTVRAGLLVVESRVAFEPPPAGAAELAGLDPKDAVELGEIVDGRHAGRTSEEEITVYKSMGHAVEDAAAARLVYDAARARGLGTDVAI
jgi:ornithine cyclodeaminase/alanine dehydrogenase-like protein (mu-crystallin family)